MGKDVGVIGGEHGGIRVLVWCSQSLWWWRQHESTHVIRCLRVSPSGPRPDSWV